MRGVLVALGRRARPVARALLRRLPPPRRAQALTLAHYAKLVLLTGYAEPWARDAASAMDDPIGARRDDAEAGGDRTVPDWVIAELHELARIEPDLYPTREYVSRFTPWTAPVEPGPGEAFARLAARVGRRQDVVLVAPYLRQGGADKGILQYLGHYRARGARTLLVTTTALDSPWIGRVPDGVEVIEAGAEFEALMPDDRRLVLIRLLLQWRPAVLHVVQSDLMWRTLQHNAAALRSSGTRLVASLFCDDYDRLGRPWSYARAYLPQTASRLDAILCDCPAYRDELRDRFGLAEGQVRPVPFHVPSPALPASLQREAPAGDGPVLWAGRLSVQKRPDLVVEIARARPERRFRVFGTAEDEAGREAGAQLARLPNVTLHGAFDGLASAAATADHACLLYTSQWDGLPNVLLEAASIGLPIVAGVVGGVGDFVDEETGFAVRPALSAGAFCEQLDRLAADPALARRRARLAFERVRARHGLAAFDAAMDAAVPWLPPRARAAHAEP